MSTIYFPTYAHSIRAATHHNLQTNKIKPYDTVGYMPKSAASFHSNMVVNRTECDKNIN